MSGALLMAASGGSFVSLSASYNIGDVSLSTASAQIRFYADGTIKNQDDTLIGNWHTPSGGSPGDNYELRATANPDTPDSGVMNTWTSMATLRQYVENSSSGIEAATFDIEIRPAGGGSVIASTTVTLTAEQTA